MRLRRVYVEAPLLPGQRHTLDGSAANHVARVLRLRVGDALTLFDGRGGEYTATVEQMRKDVVWVNVLEHRALERESPLRLILAQGISRGERMDWVVQKATELGVTGIAPIFTERSVVRLDARQSERKLQHWRAIAVAACEQSGRNRLPEIFPPLALYEFLDRDPQATSALGAMPPASRRLLLSPDASRQIADIPTVAAGVTVFIGPEGGLAEEEQRAALSVGFTPVRLGPRVLRTETAAIAALTALQQRFGDL
jgi:16S rRNA (uracil1498-N3)-methyltransferase